MNSKTMGLSNEQIQNIVKSRPSYQEIQKGIRHQQRLRFHSDTVLTKDDYRDAYTEFTRWIGVDKPELLPGDKFERFKQLIRPPIPTIELTESVYSRLHKVFHSQDAFFSYDFVTPELNSDWEDFRDTQFWSTKGFQAMQSAIDSVWVVDLPELQITSRPEPFNMLIDISNVVDIQNDDKLNCIHIIYKRGEFVVAYDNEFIRVYESDDRGDSLNNMIGGISIGAEPIKEIPHGLKYTPARQFWSEQLDSRNFINKESPITKELSDLDWLLFHMTSKKYMDLANAYPIVAVYDHDDDFNDPNRTDNKGRTDSGEKPEGNKLTGPGTIIKVPIPRGKDEADLMKDPAKMISPDVETLEWHVDEEMRLTNKIYRSVVGTDAEVKNEAAKNENQVDAAFESQISVLFRIKKNFEIIHKFADKTIAKIRYGESFVGCNIDYGTKFFLKDVNELHQDFKMAKEAGASETILEQIQTNILNTKYKEDLHSREKAEIIRDIDPLPEKTIEEAINIFEKGGIDKINFIIKANLTKFVRRFERENISLVEFASSIDYSRKIESILERFKQYANESEPGQDNRDQIV